MYKCVICIQEIRQYWAPEICVSVFMKRVFLLCVLWWFPRIVGVENDFLQIEQLSGFSPVWVLVCDFRCPARENVLVHKEHVNGFSPVCVLWWFSRVVVVVNDFLHIEHLKGFSPVWVLMCILRFPEYWNNLSQKEQLKTVFPLFDFLLDLH